MKANHISWIKLFAAIAVVAIFVFAVIITPNPYQLILQSQGANRVSNLATMESALGYGPQDAPVSMGDTVSPGFSSTTSMVISGPVLPILQAAMKGLGNSLSLWPATATTPLPSVASLSGVANSGSNQPSRNPTDAPSANEVQHEVATSSDALPANPIVVSTDDMLESFIIKNMGANANMGGSKTWTVVNTNSFPSRLLVELRNLVNISSGCINDQKKAADPKCGDLGHEGNLGRIIDLHVALDGKDVAHSMLATKQMATIGAAWNALPQIILKPDEQRTITAHWAVGENSYGNEIQGDAVAFDVGVTLAPLADDSSAASE